MSIDHVLDEGPFRCGGGGGGGAGGYVKATYVISPGTTKLMGVVNNEGPLKGGIKSSSPDGQGFLSSSVLKGQTSFRTFFYGSEFDVLNCFAGHPGKGTTGATAGGLPSFDPNQGSCKANYYHSNSLQVLVNSTGQPGLAGAAATTCWGGAGGFGGAANNGYGAGGRGGSGGYAKGDGHGHCTVQTAGLGEAWAVDGGSGHIKISWATLVDPATNFTAVYEKTDPGLWDLDVCSSTATLFCPKVGQTVTAELWSGGGGGGAPGSGIFSVGNHGGNGGGAGGFIRSTYKIPNGTTLLHGVVNKDGPQTRGLMFSRPDGFGFVTSSAATTAATATRGQTTFREINNGNDNGIITCLGGHEGKGAFGIYPAPPPTVTVQGMCGMDYTGTSPLQTLDFEIGQPGDPAHAPTSCTGGVGGAGGPYHQGYGGGGHGATGGYGWADAHGNCTAQQPESGRIDADTGGPGRIRILWDTTTNPGESGSVIFSSVGNWSLPVCAVSTKYCPGPGRIVTFELWGAGGGGNGGRSGVNGNGGEGASGGQSGAYAKITHALKPNSINRFLGKVGSGGPGGAANQGGGNGGSTTLGWEYASGYVANDLAVVQGGQGGGCNCPYSNITRGNVILTQLPSWFQHRTGTTLTGNLSSSASPGLSCTGGAGSYGALGHFSHGTGGDGGHGGYNNWFPGCTKKSNDNGLTLGTAGQTGYVKISW